MPPVVSPESSRQLVQVENFAGDADSRVMLALDPSRYLDREILQTGLFEPELSRYLRATLTPEMVCVDVGANIGYYTMLFACRARRVLAFEPAAEYRAALAWGVRANGFANVDIFPCGLSDADGVMPIATGLCSATVHWVAAEAPRAIEDVPFHRLDDLVTERFDLLKIDVDGHEMRVLEGAAEALRRHRPVVVFEVSAPHYRHAGVALVTCYEFFERLGYALACESAPEDRLTIDQFVAIASDEQRTWNFIATPA